MSQHSTSDMPIKFRGIGDRNLEDQLQAGLEGYNGVVEWQLDKLAGRIIELEQRVAVLEGGDLEPIEGQG